MDDEWKLQTIAVEAIVMAEATKQANDNIAGRNRKIMLTACCNLRERRLVDEAYLWPTFVEDVKRSLNELKFIAASRRNYYE